ncbi:MAG: LPS export ABC transporter ATP-binding protein [Treponema sp.]
MSELPETLYTPQADSSGTAGINTASASPFSAVPSVLRVEGLNKYFRKKHAVRGVTFSMKQGEVVGLLGPNGAGKTTSFYMIVGFYTPNAGGIYLDDTLINRLPMYKRARIGISYLPQEASVFRKLSVEQNIDAILEMRKDLTRTQRKEKLEFLLAEFGITGNRKQPAYTLSGGERRRTEIARALAIEPKFLLLDEPFAGIDPIAVHDIKAIIRMLSKQNIGVLITDHNVRDTLEITDRAYIINKGEIVEQGPREMILQSEIARKVYLGEEFRM